MQIQIKNIEINIKIKEVNIKVENIKIKEKESNEERQIQIVKK